MRRDRVVAVLAAVLVAGLFVGSCVTFRPPSADGPSAVTTPAVVHPLLTTTNISYVSTVDSLTLSYLEYTPTTFSNSTTYPLVVFLHGAGTGVTENISGGVGGVNNPGRLQNNSSAYGYIEISLNTRTTQPYYINTPCGGPQATDVIDAINSEKRWHKISSIYVVGFSAGSSGALIMAGHNLIPGLAGIATSGTLSDIFEEFDYLNTTASAAHYTGWEVAECNHFLSPQNTTQVRTASYESVFRFHPENFTGFKVWISSGSKDTTAENKYVSWPTYQQVNSTTLNASASVSLGLGEPLNTSKPYWNLSGGANTVVEWNSACGHSFDQIPYAKMFEFFAGRLTSGFYQDTVCASNNATFASMAGLPITTAPNTPTTPPSVVAPRQTPQFACGTGSGGSSAVGAINTMKGDTLLVLVSLGAQKVSTVTDVAGDTFAKQAIGFKVGSDRVEAWAANHSKGAPSNQVTVSNTAAGQFCLYYADFNYTEAKGFDVTGTNGTGTSGTCSSSVTTTSVNDLVFLVCMVSANVAISAGASTTLLKQNGASRSTGIGDEPTTTVGTYSPSLTFTSNAWAALAIAVHPIVVPPTVTSLAGTPKTTSVSLTWNNPSTVLVDDIVNWATTCSAPTVVKEFVVGGATVSGLSGATKYCFWLQTVNLTGISTAAVFVNVTTLPTVVTGAGTSSITASGFTASWTNPSGTLTNDSVATTTTACTGSWTYVSTAGAATSKAITGLSGATTYCVAIQAYSAGGASAPVFLNVTTLPGAPTGLTVGSVTTTTIPLSWANPSGTLVNDTVYRWAGASCSGTVTSTSLGSAGTSNTQTGLASATQFSFEVAAWSSSGTGAVSSCVQGTTLPVAPTALTVASVTTTTIHLTWSNPSGTILNDTVYRWAGSSCSGTVTATSLGTSGTSNTQTGLATASSFSFEIAAWSGGGTSATTSCVTGTTLPSAPTSLAAGTVTTTTIPLTWTNPSGTIVNDTVYRWTGAACSGTSTATSLAGVGTSNTQSGLATATQFSFEAQAWSLGGSSAVSACVSATTLPSAPTGLTVGAVTTTTIHLSWTNPSGTLVNSTVYRWTGSSCFGSVTATSLGSAGTSNTQTGLSTATQYSFEVVAWSAGGTSAVSSCVQGTTRPTAPTGLTAGSPTATTIPLSWSNPIGGSLVNDTVYRWTGGSCSGTVTATSLGSVGTSNTQSGLASATSYSFEAQAWSSGGSGAVSSCVTASTLALPPGKPTNLTSSSVTTVGFTISWTNPVGALQGDNVTLYSGGCLAVLMVGSFVVITNYTFTTLLPSTTYCVTVDASNATGQGLNATPYLNVTTLPNNGGGFWVGGQFNFAPIILLAFVVLIGGGILYKSDAMRGWRRL